MSVTKDGYHSMKRFWSASKRRKLIPNARYVKMRERHDGSIHYYHFQYDAYLDKIVEDGNEVIQVFHTNEKGEAIKC